MSYTDIMVKRDKCAIQFNNMPYFTATLCILTIITQSFVFVWYALHKITNMINIDIIWSGSLLTITVPENSDWGILQWRNWTEFMTWTYQNKVEQNWKFGTAFYPHRPGSHPQSLGHPTFSFLVDFIILDLEISNVWDHLVQPSCTMSWWILTSLSHLVSLLLVGDSILCL